MDGVKHLLLAHSEKRTGVACKARTRDVNIEKVSAKLSVLLTEKAFGGERQVRIARRVCTKTDCETRVQTRFTSELA